MTFYVVCVGVCGGVCGCVCECVCGDSQPFQLFHHQFQSISKKGGGGHADMNFFSLPDFKHSKCG